MKAGVLASLIAVSLAGCSTVAPARHADEGSLASRLVGTWEVLELVDTDASGRTTYPYGQQPRGYIVYDPTGHVHIQVMRMPATLPFAAGDANGTDREVRNAYDGYVAYFGTYDVDESRSQVIHHVQGSLMPSYTDTDQPRPVKVRGDELVIEGAVAEGRFYRRLRRVK